MSFQRSGFEFDLCFGLEFHFALGRMRILELFFSFLLCFLFFFFFIDWRCLRKSPYGGGLEPFSTSSAETELSS